MELREDGVVVCCLFVMVDCCSALADLSFLPLFAGVICCTRGGSDKVFLSAVDVLVVFAADFVRDDEEGGEEVGEVLRACMRVANALFDEGVV